MSSSVRSLIRLFPLLWALFNSLRTYHLHPEERLPVLGWLDAASVWRQYWQLTMPLVRPALAALGTLQFTWIYNEFFWATVLLGGRGEKFPITSSLNNLRGQFFSDTNLVAAGSIIVAVLVLIVFFALQKQFDEGLTLGSTKG